MPDDKTELEIFVSEDDLKFEILEGYGQTQYGITYYGDPTNPE